MYSAWWKYPEHMQERMRVEEEEAEMRSATAIFGW